MKTLNITVNFEINIGNYFKEMRNHPVVKYPKTKKNLKIIITSINYIDKKLQEFTIFDWSQKATFFDP